MNKSLISTEINESFMRINSMLMSLAHTCVFGLLDTEAVSKNEKVFVSIKIN